MVTTAGHNKPSGDCLRTEGTCSHPVDKFIHTDSSPFLMTGGDSSCQGWAVDSEMSTLPPTVPREYCSEGDCQEGPCEEEFLLPQESHSRQRKSARGASDRASPPNTESFPIPQGLPAQSQTPGTQDPCKKEATKGGAHRVTWVATHRGTALAPPPPNTGWRDNTQKKNQASSTWTLDRKVEGRGLSVGMTRKPAGLTHCLAMLAPRICITLNLLGFFPSLFSPTPTLRGFNFALISPQGCPVLRNASSALFFILNLIYSRCQTQ